MQGMLMVSPKYCTTKQTLVRLWLHETMRVFHDRLVDDQDKQHLRNILMELLGSTVGSPSDLMPEGSTIIFGDFLKPGLQAHDRPYEEVRHIHDVCCCKQKVAKLCSLVKSRCVHRHPAQLMEQGSVKTQVHLYMVPQPNCHNNPLESLCCRLPW